jgi:hypothetical protein
MTAKITAEITPMEASRVAEAANKEGMFYFSCRGDYWWRTIHTCNNDKILSALAIAHLAFALPSSELEVRKCTSLPTKLDAERNVELDSCFSAGEDIELKDPEYNQNPEELRILRNINRRGVVVFAEMQQQKQTIQDDGTKIDKLPSRMDSYANFVATRDHGNPSKGVRAGKIEYDEIPRSVAGVAYYCYGSMGTIKHSAHSHSGALQDSNSARGTAIATVSLGNILEREKLVKQAKETTYEEGVLERIRKLRQDVARHLGAFSDDTKQLIGELLAVFSLSHLFTKNIVDGFLPVVKDICKILEVNMENIQKVGLSDKQVEQIVGRFRNAEREIEQVKREAEGKTNRIVRFFNGLGGNKDPEVRQRLLTKYSLTEEDIVAEASSETTPKGSPSKPKTEDSQSPSRRGKSNVKKS